MCWEGRGGRGEGGERRKGEGGGGRGGGGGWDRSRGEIGTNKPSQRPPLRDCGWSDNKTYSQSPSTSYLLSQNDPGKPIIKAKNLKIKNVAILKTFFLF